MTDTPAPVVPPPDPNAVVLDPSAVPGNVTLAVRQIAIAVGAWATTKGWIDGSTAAMATGVVMILVPVVWGQLRRLIDHETAILAARSTPGTKVVVKGDAPIPPTPAG